MNEEEYIVEMISIEELESILVKAGKIKSIEQLVHVTPIYDGIEITYKEK